jgi:hypothetical protein
MHVMGAARTASSPDPAEFISLSSAALIVYYNIAGNPPPATATRDFARRLDAVATAIASLVPVYTIDEEGAPLRPLTKLELALAEFRGGAAQLVHRDRDLTHTDLRISQCDLLEAIHAMQDVNRPPR